MSGFYYRVRLNNYSDEFITLKNSYDGVVCIPYANSVPSTITPVSDIDYTYFRHFFDNETDFISSGWFYIDRENGFNGNPCNLYLPKAGSCEIPDDSDWQELIFLKSGSKIRSRVQWHTEIAARWSYITPDGVEITTNNINWIGRPTNFFYSTSALVALEIIDNNIGSFGLLNISAGYISQGWQQTVSGTILDNSDLITFFNEYVTPDARSNDPFEPGGDSYHGGGGGDFDGTSDDINIPSLPTLSANDAGFITLFNPSKQELNSLANYMWSNPLFDIDAWKKIFADPMNAILGLSIVPVNVPSGTSKQVTVGNIPTGIYLTTAQSQYVELDCGTINVNEYWGAYLDYDPYTKAEIYLPYCGTHPLSTDDIMGKTIHVVYHIDILSGACCAYVKCGNSVLYTFIGQCSSSIPITGDNWTNVVNGAISIAGSIGTMVATGGASAPMALGQIANTAVNQMKPSVEKSGAMGGTGGMLAIQTPYLILTRPRQALPNSQNKFIGYPSLINSNLNDLEGYTEIESIHLTGFTCTDEELSEIETLLKTGVIL